MPPKHKTTRPMLIINALRERIKTDNLLCLRNVSYSHFHFYLSLSIHKIQIFLQQDICQLFLDEYVLIKM